MMNILLRALAHQHKSFTRDKAGFTLVEIAIVVLIVGILSAIAAPSWDAFISRQRMRTVNGQVIQAIRSAQAEAKRTKSSYTVQFRYDPINDIDPPEYSIYPEPTADTDKVWEPLNANGEIGEGIVDFYSQANGADTDSITFDYLGAVDSPTVSISDTPVNTDGFTVTVSREGRSRRCTKVLTLLGATEISEGNDSATGCPYN
ncbi:MAG: Tfp pilus assembly protein FimT/FimU [Microcoleaceae cyanobacterium]